MTRTTETSWPDQIIVVELPDEARVVAAHLRRTGGDEPGALIVALEPSVRAVLVEFGFESVDTTRFFDNAAHARLLRASTELDNITETGFKFGMLPDLEDICARGAAAYIGTRLVLMLKAIEVLEGIRRAYPGRELCFCSQALQSTGADSMFISADEGFLRTLGPKFCELNGIAVGTIPMPDLAPNEIPARSRSDGWQRRMMDRSIASAYLLACKLQSRSRTVLSTTSPAVQVMDDLGRSIQERFPQVKAVRLTRGRVSRRRELKDAVAWIVGTVVGREPANEARVISQDLIKAALDQSGDAQIKAGLRRTLDAFLKKNAEHFRHQGVSLLDEVQDVVGRELVAYLMDLIRVARAQERILSVLRPALVLSWASAESYQTLGRAAAHRDIPAMVVPMKTLVCGQEGTVDLGQRQVGKDMVTDDYPYAAIQTPMSQQFLQHVGYAGQPVITGPLIRSRIDEAERHTRRDQFFQTMGAPGKIIVYAPSMKRIHPYYVIQTLDEVVSSMGDIVEMISDMDNAYLILRLHPDGVVSRSAVETLLTLPRTATISDSGRHLFGEVLTLADVLISNVSTTAEDALLNGVPVILYDKWARYNHLDAPEVHTGTPERLSPAYYVSAKAHLNSTVAWVLDNHPPGVPMSRELLSPYAFQDNFNENFYDFVGQVVHRSSHQERQ